MDELKLHISKVLLDLISLEEFENFIYQEYYVNQIASNTFIYDIITINYKGNNWKKQLEELIYDFWDETKYLTYELYKNCLKIIETDSSESISDIVDKLYELNVTYDYEYETLMQFYSYREEFGLISCGYGSYSLETLIKNIKRYSLQYLTLYGLYIDSHILLNLKKK